MYVILSRRGVQIDSYPAIKRHLQQFRWRLELKPSSWTAAEGEWPGRAAGDYNWYELQGSPSDEFIALVERPKIVYQDIQFHSWFGLDESGAVPNDTTYLLSTDDPVLLGLLNSPLIWWVMTRTVPHAKDEALRPKAYVMEAFRLRTPSGALRKNIADRVTTLCRLTEQRYVEESSFLGKLAELSGGWSDRRALNWLKRSDNDFIDMVERLSTAGLSTTAKREVTELGSRTRTSITRMHAEQLRREEELAVLVEDVYELTDEERKLLRTTRPIRDPLDVIRTAQLVPKTADERHVR
jgi:hypothetical protein